MTRDQPRVAFYGEKDPNGHIVDGIARNLLDNFIVFGSSVASDAGTEYSLAQYYAVGSATSGAVSVAPESSSTGLTSVAASTFSAVALGSS